MSFIDDDLDWRDLEIGHAKLEYARHPTNSSQKLVAAKVLILLGYAHYEGFVKFLWDRYLEHIEKEKLLVMDVSGPIRELALKKLFNKIKTSWALGDFVESLENNSALSESVSEIDPLETNSNLWPNLLETNNTKIDICLATLASHRAKLKKLVTLRNSIAHGQKLQLRNLDEVLELVDAASIVMIDMAIEIDRAIRSKRYFMRLEYSI